MSTVPKAVLGVSIPYMGGRTAVSRARATPDSAMNFAVCLYNARNRIYLQFKDRRLRS